MEKKIQLSTESTLSQQCYEQLQNEIIEGILKPDQKLKVASIKERFNIGQSPVREALSKLTSSGLVIFTDNKGFRVSMISESNIRDIYATFTAIENMALSLAIDHGDENWEATIIAELHKLSLLENKKGFDCCAQWTKNNYDFHVALIAGCNSPELLEIRHNIYKKFDRYCRLAFQISKHDLSFNNHEHKKLAQTVINRDKKSALEMMTYHINGALEDIIHNLKQNNLI